MSLTTTGNLFSTANITASISYGISMEIGNRFSSLKKIPEVLGLTRKFQSISEVACRTLSSVSETAAAKLLVNGGIGILSVAEDIFKGYSQALCEQENMVAAIKKMEELNSRLELLIPLKFNSQEELEIDVLSENQANLLFKEMEKDRVALQLSHYEYGKIVSNKNDLLDIAEKTLRDMDDLQREAYNVYQELLAKYKQLKLASLEEKNFEMELNRAIKSLRHSGDALRARFGLLKEKINETEINKEFQAKFMQTVCNTGERLLFEADLFGSLAMEYEVNHAKLRELPRNYKQVKKRLESIISLSRKMTLPLVKELVEARKAEKDRLALKD